MTNELLNELRKDFGALSPKELEEKYHKKYTAIRGICSKNKIKSNRNHKLNPCCPITYTKIRDMEEEFAKDWTDGILTKNELELKYECPYTNITTRARALDIKRYKLKDKINIKALCEDYQGDISQINLLNMVVWKINLLK